MIHRLLIFSVSDNANKDASITEIHEFVKTIPGLKESYQSLNQHINIVEELKKTTDGAAFRAQWNTERALLEGEALYDNLEDMVAEQAPLSQVLPNLHEIVIISCPANQPTS